MGDIRVRYYLMIDNNVNHNITPDNDAATKADFNWKSVRRIDNGIPKSAIIGLVRPHDSVGKTGYTSPTLNPVRVWSSINSPPAHPHTVLTTLVHEEKFLLTTSNIDINIKKSIIKSCNNNNFYLHFR